MKLTRRDLIRFWCGKWQPVILAVTLFALVILNVVKVALDG